MDVFGLISLALGSSLLTALLTQGLGWLKDWRSDATKRKDAASYLALRLAVLLEGYAYRCAELIQENGNVQTLPDEEYPEWTTKLPELPSYPDDAEGWKVLDLRLATRALDLRNRIQGSQGMINSTAEYAQDDLEEELDQQFGERGLEAWQLVIDLREKYKLGRVILIWDFSDTLLGATKSAQITKDRKAVQRAEFEARMASEMLKELE